ncbi:hypothetical protein OOU_Y34scaffold00517g12 [Pyricularia oryzae Y34]|uniref:Uncharacterized protein n=2 Tax=Pyricularia oryzae TaxID=318829 RepID=A0AA97NZ13_PYRO3|nr:hypothetical protein OOU_Y34scaffold00517g12 [Pyricularia oryzae Y34]
MSTGVDYVGFFHSGNSFEEKNNPGIWQFPRTLKLTKAHAHIYVIVIMV